MSHVRKSAPSFNSRPLVSPKIADSVRRWLQNWNIRSEQAPPKTDGTSITVDRGNRLQVIGLGAGANKNALVFASNASGTGAQDWAGTNGSNSALNSPTGSFNDLLINNNLGFRFSASAITSFGGIATAGLGVPAIYAVGAQTLYTNVAPTTLTYAPPASVGVYRFTGYLDVLTAGTMTWKIKITYKDPGGNAVTDIPGFYLQNTTAVLAGGPTANTTGRYSMLTAPFAVDNSQTAITIQDNAGTYTAGTYYWTPILEQLA